MSSLTDFVIHASTSSISPSLRSGCVLFSRRKSTVSASRVGIVVGDATSLCYTFPPNCAMARGLGLFYGLCQVNGVAGAPHLEGGYCHEVYISSPFMMRHALYLPF